jgi:cytochrome c oxidase cbb3-type subunit 3
MKFINYLTSIDGVSIYPMIGLVLFTCVFLYALISTFGARKESIEEQSRLPLDDN